MKKSLLSIAGSAMLMASSVFAQETEAPALSEKSQPWYAPYWTSSNVHVIHGKVYEDFKDDTQEIFSFEHASGYKWGDVFMFFDHVNRDGADNDFYMEVHPRLSLSYLTGADLSFGPVKDVLIATEYNKNDDTGPIEEFEAFLYGIGFSLDAPGFDYMNLNLYVRDDQDDERADGVTSQISFDWRVPFSISKSDWYFAGFFDWAGKEGDKLENFLIEARLMTDIGKIFGKEKALYTGIEYKNWENKYGADFLDEEVVSINLMYEF